MNSRFEFSLDNKRYHTYNYYLKNKYDHKVAKVALDAGFTCPNRDGSKGIGGCIFCNGKGSSDFSASFRDDLLDQYREYKEKYIDPKWPDAYTIPYFQAFSNTYGPLTKIKGMIEPFLKLDEVREISLATRSDCLSKEIVNYLDSLTSNITVWLEIGIQTSKEKTLAYINRGESFKEIKENLKILDNTNIKVCFHLINGLPGEDKKDMLNTIRDINELRYHALKFHTLLILKDTPLAKIYEDKPFKLLSKEEYLDILIDQLQMIPKEIVIERILGDIAKEELIAPRWILNKTDFRNSLDKEMVLRDSYQGKAYER